ncbi:MAG: hypothetical protein ACXABO_11290 [Promethearchaeota archaeon]
MGLNELERIVTEKYSFMDKLSNLNKNSFEEFSKKWDWWKHPKNLEFVNSVIKAIPNNRIYYQKVPRYLNETKKWLKYLKNNPFYREKFSQHSYFQIFDFLYNCDSLTFISMYNDFNQNMGNNDEHSRNKWINQHYEYLPKSSHGFNRGNVILDYNWRLSHQGNLSKYWGFVRSDLKPLIRESWLNNRSDVGKSSKYEVIITKELLNDLLDNLPPLDQIICLFLAQTGLRISDGLYCLVSKWEDLQYFVCNGEGRYYIPEVETKKKHVLIHHIFISEEIILLLDYYVPEMCQNKVSFLFKKTYSNFLNIYDQIDFLRSEFNKNLKKSFNKIKHNHLQIKNYQRIRAHLLRKYYVSKTDQVKKELGEDYLRYIAGHKTLDPLFTIYNQNLRIVESNLRKFIDFIEPSVKTGFSQKKIDILTQRKKEINEFFQLNFEKYKKSMIEKDYFSFPDILEFFLENEFRISSEEITQLILELIQKNVIQQFGSYFSFNSEEKINNLTKHLIFCIKHLFYTNKDKGISFFELHDFLLENSLAKGKNDIFILLKRLLEINIIFVNDNMFFMK